jgi:hypothetical protein
LSTPKSTEVSVPKDKSYPTDSDADAARRSGFSAQSSFENYLNNEVSKVLAIKSKKKLTPVSGEGFKESDVTDIAGRLAQNADLNDKQNKELRDRVHNLYMKGALAANRSAIASVGFDPKRMVIDTVLEHANIGGIYSPDKDSIYANFTEPQGSTIVHESIHRGLEILRKTNPDVTKLIKSIGSEELIVRYIMASMMVDTDK